MSNHLEELVRQHIPLPTHANAKGWYQVLCKVCNDHGRKGDRGGFRFDDTVTGYNCFNCGHHAVYDSSADTGLSEQMKKVLRAFGIPESDWGRVLLNSLASQQDGKGVKLTNVVTEYNPPTLTLPNYFYPLTDADSSDEMATAAIEYLTSRGVNWKDAKFFISKVTNHPNSKKWFGRIIIPAYKDNNLIFYQGRDLSGLRVKKYESPSNPKQCVLSNFDFLTDRVDRDVPLYVTEGWFDAYHVDGVAVLGRQLTPQQIYWLNKTPRPKVIIPDKFGDGIDLAKSALKQGWSVATPDINDSKDINDAVLKYGKLYVLNSLRDNTHSDFEAQVRISIYCE